MWRRLPLTSIRRRYSLHPSAPRRLTRTRSDAGSDCRSSRWCALSPAPAGAAGAPATPAHPRRPQLVQFSSASIASLSRTITRSTPCTCRNLATTPRRRADQPAPAQPRAPAPRPPTRATRGPRSMSSVPGTHPATRPQHHSCLPRQPPAAVPRRASRPGRSDRCTGQHRTVALHPHHIRGPARRPAAAASEPGQAGRRVTDLPPQPVGGQSTVELDHHRPPTRRKPRRSATRLRAPGLDEDAHAAGRELVAQPVSDLLGHAFRHPQTPAVAVDGPRQLGQPNDPLRWQARLAPRPTKGSRWCSQADLSRYNSMNCPSRPQTCGATVAAAVPVRSHGRDAGSALARCGVVVGQPGHRRLPKAR